MVERKDIAEVEPIVAQWIRERGTMMDGASYAAALELAAYVAARRTTPDPANGAFVSRVDLDAIYAAMNHLGDILNEMDAVEAEDEAATEPGFIAIRRALGEKE